MRAVSVAEYVRSVVYERRTDFCDYGFHNYLSLRLLGSSLEWPSNQNIIKFINLTTNCCT